MYLICTVLEIIVYLTTVMLYRPYMKGYERTIVSIIKVQM